MKPVGTNLPSICFHGNATHLTPGPLLLLVNIDANIDKNVILINSKKFSKLSFSQTPDMDYQSPFPSVVKPVLLTITA